MADNKKPTKTGNKVKSDGGSGARRKPPASEEIGFIVRREHRRQHRQDRAL